MWTRSVLVSASLSRALRLLVLAGLLAGCRSGPAEQAVPEIPVSFEMSWPVDSCPLSEGEFHQAQLLVDEKPIGEVREGHRVAANLPARPWEITVLDGRNGPWRTVIDPSAVHAKGQGRVYRLVSPGMFPTEHVGFRIVRSPTGGLILQIQDKWARAVDAAVLIHHGAMIRRAGEESPLILVSEWSAPDLGYPLPVDGQSPLVGGESISVRFTGETKTQIPLLGEATLVIPG